MRKQIAAFAARQSDCCRALQADYGIGPITAAALWRELGDSARFSASRKAVSPDYAYHRRVADRIGGGRATLPVACKMVRRAHHTVRALGDQALAPPEPQA